MKRRDFAKLGLGAVAAAGMFSLAGCSTEETSYDQITADAANSQKGKHWAMAIDVKKFNDLDVMNHVQEVCHTDHNVPDTGSEKTAVKWIWPESFENLFEDLESEYQDDQLTEWTYPALCNHCEQAPCVKACPTEATFKREDGIVMMDFHRCIGCRFCMTSCPFGARSLNFSDPRLYLTTINTDYPTRTKGVVEKCMFCYERIDQGLMPLCVDASQGAIHFGDLNDEKSDVRTALKNAISIRRKVNLGTGPSVYYIIKGGE